MDAFRHAIRQLITISDDDFERLLVGSECRTYRRWAVLSQPGSVPNHIFFILKGTLRMVITDTKGVEHTTHFALENQFIVDYASFLLGQSSVYTLQAVEETEVVILPRQAIEWGYQHLPQGDRLGRLVAEGYFIYHDDRIRNLYARSPKERYDALSTVFPNIHNRVPQHMIASYLGITPVHLSRLKKADRAKV